MNRHFTPSGAWVRAHAPFLRLLAAVIVLGLAVNLAVYVYGSVVLSRIRDRNDRNALETRMNGEITEKLVYYTENPREMVETTPDGTHYRMEKISDAGSPNDTWHIMGWRKTENGEIYRLEGCFAAPASSGNQSN